MLSRCRRVTDVCTLTYYGCKTTVKFKELDVENYTCIYTYIHMYKQCDKKQPCSAQAVVALGNEHLSWYRKLCQKVPMLTQILTSSSVNLQVQVIWVMPSLCPVLSVSAQAKSRCSNLAQTDTGPFQRGDLILLCWPNTQKSLVPGGTAPPPGINSDCKTFLILYPNISEAAQELKPT